MSGTALLEVMRHIDVHIETLFLEDLWDFTAWLFSPSLFQPGIWGTRLFVRKHFCLKWSVTGLPNERLSNGPPEGSYPKISLTSMGTERLRSSLARQIPGNAASWSVLLTEQILKGALILLGRSCGIGFTPSLRREGRVCGSERVLSLNAVIRPRSVLSVGSRGDGLEVRPVLK